MTTPPPTEPSSSERSAQPAPAGDGASPASAADLAEMEDRWRRALAEAENLRKRVERQVADQIRTERARTAAAFLPVLDNLELALRHASADPGSIVAGVERVWDQAVEVLERSGIRRMRSVGERFDPVRHEAARVVQANGVEPGTVTEVLREGYVDADGVPVRPAVVVVATAGT